MSEHTEEPWVLSNHTDGFGIAKETNRGNYWIADCIPHQPDGATEEANARRIVACVNACEGIATEYLEKFRGTTFNDFKRVKQQRDKLLAMLKDLINIEGQQPGNKEWADNVIALIAEIEATQS